MDQLSTFDRLSVIWYYPRLSLKKGFYMTFIATGGLVLLSLFNQTMTPVNSITQIPTPLSGVLALLPSDLGNQEAIPDPTEIELDVPYIHQYKDLPENRKVQIRYSACGPTSLAMAFQFAGVNTSLIEVIDKVPSSVYVKGSMFYNLYDGTKIYGYNAEKIGKTPQDFYNALKDGHPVIINIQNYNGVVGHAMVVTGIKGFNAETNTAESLIAHDPSTGPNEVFEFIGKNQLKQPSGQINSIGILDPFYLVKE